MLKDSILRFVETDLLDSLKQESYTPVDALAELIVRVRPDVAIYIQKKVDPITY